MKPAIFALALGPLFASPAVAQSAADRREATVAIQSARAVYRDVEAALTRRELTRRDTMVTCPENDLDVHASLYLDRRHRVRRLDTEGGTDDHGEDVAAYFDTLSRPRFAFATRGAVNGTQQEERVYYDERGRVVRRQVRQLRGPGYLSDTLSVVPRVATWRRDLCR